MEDGAFWNEPSFQVQADAAMVHVLVRREGVVEHTVCTVWTVDGCRVGPFRLFWSLGYVGLEHVSGFGASDYLKPHEWRRFSIVADERGGRALVRYEFLYSDPYVGTLDERTLVPAWDHGFDIIDDVLTWVA